MRKNWKIAILIASIGFMWGVVRAQDAAEYGAASGQSSMGVQTIRIPVTPPADTSKGAGAPDAKAATSPNLPLSPSPSPAEANRKTLEHDAGKHAAKLLLRSTPGTAEVFVNDLAVGRTPVLLLVPAGKYKISMRGDHQEWGDETIGVLPDETQVVLLHLKPRYPSSITLH
jgi:hypothetical protein